MFATKKEHFIHVSELTKNKWNEDIMHMFKQLFVPQNLLEEFTDDIPTWEAFKNRLEGKEDEDEDSD